MQDNQIRRQPAQPPRERRGDMHGSDGADRPHASDVNAIQKFL